MIPILLAFAFIAILFVIVIAGQPGEFTYTRSLKMSAPPEKIFPFVNDLHQWEAWSPWAKLDPKATPTFSGAAAGLGASMAWSGNNKVGQGKMTIIQSQPSQSIRFRLEFLKPMVATNLAEFNFQPESGGTTVVWATTGKNNFMGRIFGLFVNCEKMVGAQFAKGLANLAELVR